MCGELEVRHGWLPKALVLDATSSEGWRQGGIFFAFDLMGSVTLQVIVAGSRSRPPGPWNRGLGGHGNFFLGGVTGGRLGLSFA